MKNLKGILFALCILFVAGCKDEKETPVRISDFIVTSPAEGTYIDIDPKSNAVVKFQWDIKASDGTMLFQEVIFDKEDGDFSDPVYRIQPAKNGIENKVSISHKELNKIAYYSGIAEQSRGKIKWKVLSTNGVVASDPEGYGIIEVKRPAGLALNPESVLLYGEATDAGSDDVSKAVSFKRLSDGVFESYTALKAGTYKMEGKVGESSILFKLDGNAITSGSSGVSPVTEQTVYRITLDFNESMATLTEIQAVGLWVCAHNKITVNLNYQGYGLWKVSDSPIVFKQESWGKDDRYNFRIIEKDASGQLSTRALGSSSKDNSRPGNNTPASYFFLKPIALQQWDYSYKFEKETSKADIEVMFQQSSDYTHKIIYK